MGIDYTLRLEDGQVIDSSEERDPLEFLQGHGQIVPGLEQAIYGMAIGDKKEVVVEPEAGYGEVDPDAYQRFPREAFPSEMELEPGMGLELVDGSGQPFLAVVAEVGPENVLLDFNHPLAGETLHFDVQVVSLRAANSEELAHGHAH
ncbi:MAG: peptidylprolyl isomerase [Anaerolineae bacterium]|nr:peptidylprolyl isomerase [Anaerolineae bacterium]